MFLLFSCLFFPFLFLFLLPHWRQSQLGKRWCSAAGSSWDDLQSTPLKATAHTFLDARLELFWVEDWSALWATVRAECDVAPVQNTTRRTDKQQMQSPVRKVATLTRTGEKGRALAAARNAPPVPGKNEFGSILSPAR